MTWYFGNRLRSDMMVLPSYGKNYQLRQTWLRRDIQWMEIRRYLWSVWCMLLVVNPFFFLVIWKAGVSSVRLPVYICPTRDPRWDWQLPFYLGKLEKCVIGQAWARNSWILADLFLAFLWTKTFWYFVSKTEHSGKSQPVLPVWKPRRMVLSCC